MTKHKATGAGPVGVGAPSVDPTTVNAAAVAGKLLEVMPVWLHALSVPLRHSNGDIDGTLTQMRTLYALQQGPLTFKQLISWRKVAPPTLSRTIDALVKRGWVDRIPHPDDKRQVLLKLTDEGMTESIRLRTLMHERASQLVGHLDGDERHCLFLGLAALLRDLQAVDCSEPHSHATDEDDGRRKTDDRRSTT